VIDRRRGVDHLKVGIYALIMVGSGVSIVALDATGLCDGAKTRSGAWVCDVGGRGKGGRIGCGEGRCRGRQEGGYVGGTVETGAGGTCGNKVAVVVSGMGWRGDKEGIRIEFISLVHVVSTVEEIKAVVIEGGIGVV